MFSYTIKTINERGLDVYEFVRVEGSPMPDTYLNNRPVYIGDIHLDGVDSFIESAAYCDTNELLSDDDLDSLTEQESDMIVQANCEHFGYFPK